MHKYEIFMQARPTVAAAADRLLESAGPIRYNVFARVGADYIESWVT